jgi:hypothetical protein
VCDTHPLCADHLARHGSSLELIERFAIVSLVTAILFYEIYHDIIQELKDFKDIN